MYQLFITVFFMILYIAVIVYLILLFGRLVRAVEAIAKKIEGSSKIWPIFNSPDAFFEVSESLSVHFAGRGRKKSGTEHNLSEYPSEVFYGRGMDNLSCYTLIFSLLLIRKLVYVDR